MLYFTGLLLSEIRGTVLPFDGAIIEREWAGPAAAGPAQWEAHVRGELRRGRYVLPQAGFLGAIGVGHGAKAVSLIVLPCTFADCAIGPDG